MSHVRIAYVKEKCLEKAYVVVLEFRSKSPDLIQYFMNIKIALSTFVTIQI